MTIIEPSGTALVASGIFPREHFIGAERDLFPSKAEWIRDRVAGFRPEENKLVTRTHNEVGYT
ncbi:MAG: hypothetical protein WKF67_07625 [Rubrobacteraceae bacterium]